MLACRVNTTLFGESYVYDCIRNQKYQWAGEPQTCWGDTGNGEQTGWFVWGSILARRAVKNELARVAGS